MSYLGNKPGLGQTSIADLAPDVLEALKNAFYGTPDQFDNDLSLVSSAFVQRALGSLSGAADINSGAFGDNSQFGKNLNLGTGSSYLPSTVGLPQGASLHYKNTGVNSHTLSRVGSDLISCDGSTQTTIVVEKGEDLTLTKVNGVWIGRGSATLKYAAGFSASLSINGYQKLPSGLIVQWGTFPAPANSTTTITFPIAFPNACRSVVATVNDDLGTVTTYPFSAAKILNASSFSLRSYYSQSGINNSWLAIGY